MVAALPLSFMGGAFPVYEDIERLRHPQLTVVAIDAVEARMQERFPAARRMFFGPDER